MSKINRPNNRESPYIENQFVVTVIDEARAIWLFMRHQWYYALAVILAIAVLIFYFEPLPPSHIRLSKGQPNSSLEVEAKYFKQALEENGIKTELIESKGTLDSLKLLEDKKVDIALSQSGLPIKRSSDIVSLGSYKHVFHFEDDNRVLKSCSQILDPITRYVGINVIKDNEKYKFQPVECRPTISFTIVGPPCSYKTTILQEIKCRIEKQGIIVVIVSPDLEESILRQKTEYSDMSVKIPPEIKFAAIQRRIKKAPIGSIILYDMCHDKGDMLKDILKSNGLAVSFVPHTTLIKKTKNGDKESHSPVKEYVNYIIKKAINRSESKEFNGTTLITSDIDKLTKIITDKISGCVHQKTTRDVKYLGDGSILTYDEQLELVWNQFEKFLVNSQDEKVIALKSFYLAAPLDIPNLSEDGYY